MLTHAGEEGGVIVKGRIELTVGGESRVLGAGDAYYFKSSIAAPLSQCRPRRLRDRQRQLAADLLKRLPRVAAHREFFR